MYSIADLVALTFTVFLIAIFVHVVLSWVKPDTTEFPRNLTSQVTEPLYSPIRAIINPQALGGLDISPLLVILLLQFMERLVLG